MQHPATILDDKPEADTLGGRISTARDALDMSIPQLARRLGVKTETISAWEGDRSEPRANRLIMLAGILGVAPTWLLSGFGSAPASQSLNSALGVVTLQLAKLKEQHQRTAAAIDALEREIGSLGRNLQDDA
ncbi:helix-turn-helix domain-containing protein [Rhizobium sp. EC-SD404]|uniref:helix-turn-helix domain-containing protein n=1 Tax=Rhizobium sp. EC-SD404 TaxID=2038389 RepID=UPI001253D45C|nr:helix-turn-helix domain-containing protein [Rhizobium sp. EC-SD404]VVT19705.1 Helix-turn-helix [Rhizobium sp. EC-SD404]